MMEKHDNVRAPYKRGIEDTCKSKIFFLISQ